MSSHSTRRRLLLAAVVAASALAGSVVPRAVAVNFPDVSGFFASAVDNITDAGCARGFPDGTFDPSSGATRAQFAYWLNNCGGRTAEAGTPNVAALDVTWADVDNPTITIGGDAGNRQYLNVTGWIEVDDDGVECPCDLEMRFELDGPGASDTTSATAKQVIVEGSGGDIDDTIFLSWQFPVVPGTTYTLRSQARVFGSTTTPISMTLSDSHVSAMTAPFGARGGNPSAAPESIGGEETPDAVLNPSGNPNG